MKVTTAKSGAYTTMEKLFPSGMYLVKLYRSSGELADKVRCDDYRNACDYKRSFDKIARNS